MRMDQNTYSNMKVLHGTNGAQYLDRYNAFDIYSGKQDTKRAMQSEAYVTDFTHCCGINVLSQFDFYRDTKELKADLAFLEEASKEAITLVALTARQMKVWGPTLKECGFRTLMAGVYNPKSGNRFNLLGKINENTQMGPEEDIDF